MVSTTVLVIVTWCLVHCWAFTLKLGAFSMYPNERLTVPASIQLAVNEINADSTNFPDVQIQLNMIEGLRRDTPSIRVGVNSFLNLSAWSPHVYLGPPFSGQAVILAPLADVYGAPMISYLATRTALSDKSKYPSFVRTIPPDHFWTRVIVKFLVQNQWKPVVVLVENTEYGNGLFEDFASQAGKSGIEILRTVRIAESTDAAGQATEFNRLKDQMNGLKDLPVKVIVTLGSWSIQMVLNASVQVNMIGAQSGYLHILSDSAGDMNVWMDKNTGKPFPWAKYGTGVAFVADYPDYLYLPTTQAYRNKLNETHLSMFGNPLDVSEFENLWTHFFSYRAVYAAAKAVQIAITRVGAGSFSFDYKTIMNILRNDIRNVSVLPFGLDKNGDPSEIIGSAYFVKYDSQTDSVEFVESERYYMQTEANGDISSRREVVQPFVYPDGSTQRPKLVDEISVSSMKGVVSASIALFVFLGAFLLAILGLFIWKRDLPILKFTSWTFHSTVILGLLLITTSVLPVNSFPSMTTVVAQHALLTLGFTIVLWAIVLKNYRIYVILVMTKSLKTERFLTDMELFGRLGIMAVLQSICLILWAQLLNPGPIKQYQQGFYQWSGVLSADGHGGASFALVYAIPLLGLSCSTAISILTRNVAEKKFNESVVAGTVNYSIVLIAGFAVLNTVVLLPDQNVRRDSVNIFLVLLGVFVTFLLYSGKSAYYVINEAFLGKRLYDTDVQITNKPTPGAGGVSTVAQASRAPVPASGVSTSAV